MRRHGLDQRMALWLLTRRGVTRSPFTLFAALGAMTAILSMWMSNVATTAMMLPVATGVLNACPGLRDNRRLQCDLVLLIAFAASVGGLGTPVGTPPNIIAMGFLKKLSGDSITFVDWMKIGVPLVFVLTAFLLWWLRPKGVVFTDRAAMDADLLARRSALGQPSLWSLVAAGVILSIILSEATSNTASANVMVPLFIILAGSASLPQRPVALAVSLACSFGFMLPVSTGPNAMAYSTGLVPLPRMIRAGIALDIVGAAAVWLAVRLLS